MNKTFYGDAVETALAKACGFTIKTETRVDSWGGRSSNYEVKSISGEFTKPEKDFYFKVSGKPAREGTIGRMLKYEPDDKFEYQLEFDDRKNVLKFSAYDVEFLPNYNGPTVYVYERADPTKREPIPIIKNKFGQTLEKDDLVVGVGGRYGSVEIVFGYVTRWTRAGNIFIKPYGPFGSPTNITRGDIQLKDAKETIKLPKEAELEKDLFSCVLGADY